MAVPVKEAPIENSPYAVNKELFEDSTKIKNQMELIQKRLQKMEEHRKEVSDSVYLKVKTDYETQMEEVAQAFEGKCGEVENELQQLYQAQAEQEAELGKHQEILEEAKFRHTLGEYTDKKFKEIEVKQNKEIKKFNGILEIIKASIQQYETILGHPFTPSSSRAASKKSRKEGLKEVGLEIQAEEVSLQVEEPERTPAAMSSKVPEESLTQAQLPPVVEEATSAPSFEEGLEEELDSFLQTEGDYFGGEVASPEPVQSPKMEKTDSVKISPEKPPAKKPLPRVSTTQPDDDSISSILRDIPMEESVSEEMPVAENAEPTGPDLAMGTAPKEATLLLLEGNLDEHEFSLSENTSIGRSPSNDIVLKETKISRQHASINYRDGNFIIVDLKSSNGVTVNGKKIEEQALQDGDEIRIGSYKFQFNIL